MTEPSERSALSFYEECADLYDVAFSWSVADEVDWLLARLGPGVQSVLEPAPGSGRMFPQFAARGVQIWGVELSEEMIRRAVERAHVLRQWNWREWSELVASSPFSLSACYDGEPAEREALPRDHSLDNRHLVWHELTAG